MKTKIPYLEQGTKTLLFP